MSQYNIIQAIYMSFYSRKLYQDVGKNWGGKTFLYLAFLLALSWIGFTINAQIKLNRIYAVSSDEVIAQIPVMTVIKGKISTPEKKPYLIKDPSNNKVFAIIDTTGQYSDISKNDVSVLVTETTVSDKMNKNEMRIYQIPETYSGTINPVTINKFIERIISFVWIFLFIMFFLTSYVYRIIQAMIYALLGKLYCAASGSQVNYGTIVQITMVAITPAIVIATILDYFSITFPKETLMYLLISICYMIYGIRANNE